MTIDPTILVGGGTAGLIAFLILAVNALWNDHKKRDEADRKNLDLALDGWRVQTYASKELAEAEEQRAKRERERV